MIGGSTLHRLGRVPPAGAIDQEIGQLHGWAGAALQLALHGPPILAHGLGPAAGFQLAALNVQKDLDFPGLEAVARNYSARQLAHQPVEAVEHQLQLNQVVCRRHSGVIGS